MYESDSASWTVFNSSGLTPLSAGTEKCWLDSKISFAKQMLKLSQSISSCPIIIRKREIRVWFSCTGNTPKAFDISSGYHVVLTINIPTATTAICVSMPEWGTPGGCDIAVSMTFRLWSQDALFWGTEYCEVVQGYVILTLYTTLLHIHASHLLLTLHNVHLVLLHTPQKIVELLWFKLCIICVCCIPLISQVIHNIWSVFCLA